MALAKKNILEKFVWASWAIYLVVFPFYLLPSGRPQISNIIFLPILTTVFFARNIRIAKELIPILKILICFGIYIFFVNGMVSITNVMPLMNLPTLFYAFNLMLVFVVFNLYSVHGKSFLRFTAICICLSALIQVLYIPFGGAKGIRVTAGFNNPNQLGYYSVLVASSVFVLRSKLNLSLPLYLCTTCCTAYLSMRSLSKAAMVSVLVAIIISLWHRPIVVLLLAAFTVLLLSFFDVGVHQATSVTHAKHRLEQMGADSDDSLSSRGYDRLLRYPEYLIFGGGMGAVYRNEGTGVIEIHSTLGYMLFSYGFFGFSIFLYLLFKIFNYVDFYSFTFLIPSILYGLTHNGFRSSFFWLFLGLLICSRPIHQHAPKEISV